jgi:hypothetical protein
LVEAALTPPAGELRPGKNVIAFPSADFYSAFVPDPKMPDPAIIADWHLYEKGGRDTAGRVIENIYTRDKDYVIYFSGGDMFYEAAEPLLEKLGNANVALARINRLLPATASSEKTSTLELVADAFEMIFMDQVAEGLGILSDIRDKLQIAPESIRRLVYQLGAITVTVTVWIVYLVMHSYHWMPHGWDPWMLAAALALAGGAFSICLNLGSLQVSVNQGLGFLYSAGTTRSVVALLSGVGLLLAMRAKMIAGLAYGNNARDAVALLNEAEMFFCFLAGFSETFVPNILRDSEKNPAGGGAKQTEQAKTAEQAKEEQAKTDAAKAAQAKIDAAKAEAEKAAQAKAAELAKIEKAKTEGRQIV